jgi:predicted nucleic acid-binding protein
LGERLNGIQEVVSSILIGSTKNDSKQKRDRQVALFVCSNSYDGAVIVYLDICALKRPFDDARSERIRREAEAVARIFEKVENGSIQLVVSPAHRFENDRNPREDRRLATDLWLEKAARPVDATPDIDERARLLAGLGFGPLDALHLALAEKAEARWFVTTDERLLRKAFDRRDEMRVEVVRPDQLTLDQENEP